MVKRSRKHYLPKPDCELGYPLDQVYVIVGHDRRGEFNRWISGQTMALCNNHAGGIVYPWDLVGFLDNVPITD